MEYVSGKKVRMAYYPASRHNVKRQKLSMESNSCKGILISPINQKKMSPAVKEFLIYLKMNHSKNSENSENSQNRENEKMSREENAISFKKEVKEINGIKENNEVKEDKEDNKKQEDVEKNENREKRESKDNKENMKNDTEETNIEKEEKDINVDEDHEKEKVRDEEDDFIVPNVEKQLEEEIKQMHIEFERFTPIRSIVKNYTFIKFHESATDITPSDIVTKLFTDIYEKKNKYRFRMVCKIIPFDYICKPHLTPFVKTIVPVLKKTFTEGNCVQKNMTPSDLLKLLNVSQEEREQVQAEEAEAKKKEKEKEKEKSNDDNNNDNDNNMETKNTTVLENDKNKKIAEKEVKEDNEEKKEKKDVKVEEKKEKKKEKQEEGCQKPSWALIYKRANTDNLKKRDVLTVIDNCIGKNYSVNLSNPDFAIIVHINEIMCGISIMKDYGKTKKLNISAFKQNYD